MIESMKICLILLVVVAISSTQAQDPNFCRPVPDPNNKPKPTLDIYSQFQATIEINKNGVTEILKEYYDGLLNIGIAIQTTIGITIKAYCYYSLNEGLSISGDTCNVFKLNETGTIVDGIFDIQNVNGINHIKSPLSSLLQNPIFNYVYTGVGEARGIAVDQWQACYYASQSRTNFKITVSFSSSRWPSMKESPVQILIETKVDGTDTVVSESYSIVQYRPFLTIEEEEYFTPSGVYCPGRFNQREVPKMPEHFRFLLQAATQLGTPDNGLIETFAEEYNYRNKLFKFVHDDRNFIVTDIHDYNTGWSYSIDRYSGNCTRAPLTLNVSIDSAINNGIVGLRDPKKFFDFDSLNPQYIGLKRRDGVNNDVYVGKGQLFGINVVAEWYFLSSGWQASQIWPGMLKDGFQLPIEIKFFLELPIGKQIKYNHLFAFEPKRMDLRDFDISECTHNVDKRHYMFSLKNDLSKIIKSNEHEFIHSLTQVLHQNARVTILRLSRIDMAFDVDQIHIFFTLSEKVESYGPVEIPKDDLPLEEAEKTLRDAFNGDKIQIQFYDWVQDTTFTVPVIKDSLKQVFFNETHTIVIDRDMTKKGYSDGTTGIVTIVAAILGLVVGVLATMVIKYKKIKLPLINN